MLEARKSAHDTLSPIGPTSPDNLEMIRESGGVSDIVTEF
jgi:hypothetical protein